MANGSAAATRSFAGQATKLARAEHDIVYDPVNDEIIIANPFAQAILTFRGGATGEEPPIRVLQGPSTQMMHPDYGIAVDPVHNELIVSEKEQISVFPRTANGDAAPLRMIRGTNTLLRDSRGLVVDPNHNLIVAGTHNGLVIFNRTDNGNVKPRAVISGPHTGIQGTIQNLRLYAPKGLLVAVANAYGRGEEGEEESSGSRTGGGRNAGSETSRRYREIGVWNVTDNGDVPPLFVLGGPKTEIEGGRIALNPKGKEVIVGGGTVVKTYSFPELF